MEEYITYMQIIALIILVALAALADIRTRKIPNKLTVSFAALGLVVNAVGDFPQGILTGLIGLAVGFLVFIIPYITGFMGAGDVKLMAAIGAISNWRVVIAITFAAAINGAILVFVARIARGGLMRTFKRTGRLLVFGFLSMIMIASSSLLLSSKEEQYLVDTSDKKRDYIPYALAIALGTVTIVVLSRTGFITGLFF